MNKWRSTINALEAFILFVVLAPAAHLSAEALLPTAPGTNWPYHMTQRLGEGIGISGAPADASSIIHAEVVYRLEGTEAINDQPFLKFEMHRNNTVTNTEFIAIDDEGIHCSARIGPDGERFSLVPPQTIVAAPLKLGLIWDFDGKAGDSDVHQHYEVVGENEISVSAGRFHAFHIHCDQSAPDPMTIERWFVPGIGIVKDVTTMKNKDGGMLQRIELELKEPPQVGPRPVVKDVKKLVVGVSSDPIGPFSTEFSTDTPKIYARWQGHGLRSRANVRVVWIAEDVGDVAPPNYKIDEATAVATAPNAHGLLTLSRPAAGWALGSYRVEFYVDNEQIETVKLKITQPERFK
jgi:hypothetical protein